MERLRAKGAPQSSSFLMHWLNDYDVRLKIWLRIGMDFIR